MHKVQIMSRRDTINMHLNTPRPGHWLLALCLPCFAFKDSLNRTPNSLEESNWFVKRTFLGLLRRNPRTWTSLWWSAIFTSSAHSWFCTISHILLYVSHKSSPTPLLTPPIHLPHTLYDGKTPHRHFHFHTFRKKDECVAQESSG